MEIKHVNIYFLTLFLLSLVHLTENLSQSSYSHSLLQIKQVRNNNAVNTNTPLNKLEYNVIYGPCSSDVCKGPHGYCENKNTCQCLHGYANYHNKSKPSTSYCQYAQKSQLTSFFLELFLTSGIGHLYSGRLITGLIKLIFTILFCVIYALLRFYLNSEEKTDIFSTINENHESDSADTEKCLGVVFCLTCCGLFLWQIVDLIMIGLNKYNDGNDVPLASW